MVKIEYDTSITESDANLVVNIVNCSGYMDAKWQKLYPHVDIQYRKYLVYCNKNNIEPMGTCQYVPKDSWAIGLTDTMKNNDLYNYDEPYQFIVNMFVDKSTTNKIQIDFNALNSALKNLKQKAKILKATIAIPYGIDFVGYSKKWKVIWEQIWQAIHKCFDNSDIEVYLCKNTER